MTADQERRLIEAVKNVEELANALGAGKGTEIIETAIMLYTGAFSRLIEENDDMPRGRKTNAQKAAEAAATIIAPPPGEYIQAVVIPEVPTTEQRDTLIAEWKSAHEQFTYLKERERALRTQLVQMCFDGTRLEGTENVDIGWDYKLRCVKDMSYIATDDNNESQRLIELLELRGASELAEGLIAWEPKVAKKIYRQVFDIATQQQDTEILAALHAAITIKPGMPQLELVPPKTDAQVA